MAILFDLRMTSLAIPIHLKALDAVSWLPSDVVLPGLPEQPLRASPVQSHFIQPRHLLAVTWSILDAVPQKRLVREYSICLLIATTSGF